MTSTHFLTPQQHLDAEFMQLLLQARLDGLWATLAKEEKGLKPSVHDEDAKGKLDGGGLILPRNLMQENARGERVYSREEGKPILFSKFQEQMKKGLSSDGATLVFPDKVLSGENIPNRYIRDIPDL